MQADETEHVMPADKEGEEGEEGEGAGGGAAGDLRQELFFLSCS